MKAMILAAGIGSRLKPHTDHTPKALTDINGLPLLEIIIRRLLSAHVKELIINIHHFPDQIRQFLQQKNNFGIRIELSHEEELLDTGGGLKKASWFFTDAEPFFLHNADILTNLDLAALMRAHLNKNPLATLAVRSRKSARKLIFDSNNLLCGWESLSNDHQDLTLGPPSPTQSLAFDGIHVINPRIFQLLTETGAFSMTKVYLRLIETGQQIEAFRSDQYFWQTIGDPARLDETRKFASNHWQELSINE